MRSLKELLLAPFIETDVDYILGTPYYVAPEVIGLTVEECIKLSKWWTRMGYPEDDESS